MSSIKKYYMKRLSAFVLSLAVLAGAKGFAQDEVTAIGVRFGLKAGINIANITAKTSGVSFSPSSVVRPTGGFFATIPVAEGFAIQPEILYSGLGAKIAGGKILYDYLTLPVLAKYSFEEAGFGAYLGPQIGYLLSAKGKYGGETEDIKEEVKSTDISGIIGVEYFLPMGVGLSARYQLGLSNVAKDTEDEGSVKNKALTFTLGYRF